MLPRRPVAVAASTLLLTGLASGLLAGCAGHASASRTPTPSSTPSSTPGTAVGVSVSGCGTGWQPSTAGAQHLVLHNTDSRAGSVQLVGAHDAVFAEADPLGPGTTTTVDVRLAAGTYFLRCLMEDEPAVTGRPVHITGHTTGASPGVRPVDQADLVRPTQAYQRYVTRRLGPLAAQVAELSASIESGDRPGARREWLSAHLAYERLGAAYDAFGELDAAVNGTPDGLPRGVADPRWTGFHRVERGLWHGEPAATLAPAATRLAADVHRLQRHFRDAQIDPLTMAIRAHEISENALQLTLTGGDDFGSHSSLRTVQANLDGTAVVLRLLHPLLVGRLATLPQLTADLRRTRRIVTADAGTPLGDLRTRDRERVDAAVSGLCERLADVASILEPRRTS